MPDRAATNVEKMKTALSADVSRLKAAGDVLESTVKNAPDEAKGPLKNNLDTLKAVLDRESQYVGQAAPEKPEETVSCDCPGGSKIIDLQHDLAAANPDDLPAYTSQREKLANCIRSLRSPAKLKCADNVKTLEDILTSDVKALIAKRDETARELATTDTRNEHDLTERLSNIKTALKDIGA